MKGFQPVRFADQNVACSQQKSNLCTWIKKFSTIKIKEFSGYIIKNIWTFNIKLNKYFGIYLWEMILM